jgi:hypothetical protein
LGIVTEILFPTIEMFKDGFCKRIGENS